MRGLSLITEYFWPPGNSGDYLDIARRRSLNAFCLLAAFLSAIVVIKQLSQPHADYSVLYTIILMSFVVYFVCPILLMTGWKTSSVGYIFCGYSIVRLCVIGFHTGGIISVQSIFFLPCILVVALLYGWREGIAVTALAFSLYISAYVFRDSLAANFLIEQTVDNAAFIMLVGLGASAIFVLSSAAIFQREMTKAAQKLAESRVEAEAASKAKSDFLATMSHEIRTPMNGVLGMSELLKETDLTSKQEMFADTIHRSGNALLTIINDILDFSKIEARKLELNPEPFELAAAVDDVAELLGATAREKNLELVVRHCPKLPKAVMGDPGRIRQIITNLAGNAIKFTKAGYVLVDVRGEQKDDAVSVKISVEDTGIGISADKIDHVFEKFTQAESTTTRNFGGTGLGLAITQSLVELMGGKITVESVLGQGSTFTVALKLPVVELQPQETPSTQLLNGTHVLVVDDLPVNRQILEELLSGWGATPLSVSSGAGALDLLRSSAARGAPVPLVLLDFHMPEMDGLMLTREIRGDPALAHTKLIVLSSNDAETVAGDFENEGVSQYLVKPVRSAALYRAICEALTDINVDQLQAAVSSVGGAAVNVATEDENVSDLRPRVLVADDNLVNRMVIENMIDQNKFSVVFVENGLLAVEAVKNHPFELIFMDISMPEMDGIEATGEIRAHEKTHGVKPTPIIALTAHAMAGDEERFVKAGMDDYLAKPVKKDRVEAMLEKWMPAYIKEDMVPACKTSSVIL